MKSIEAKLPDTKFMRVHRSYIVNLDKISTIERSHIVFSKILPELKNAEIFGCYPEVFPCRPIAEANALFGDIDQWNIYKKMAEWNWKGSLEDAFRKLYL